MKEFTITVECDTSRQLAEALAGAVSLALSHEDSIDDMRVKDGAMHQFGSSTGFKLVRVK